MMWKSVCESKTCLEKQYHTFGALETPLCYLTFTLYITHYYYNTLGSQTRGFQKFRSVESWRVPNPDRSLVTASPRSDRSRLKSNVWGFHYHSTSWLLLNHAWHHYMQINHIRPRKMVQFDRHYIVYITCMSNLWFFMAAASLLAHKSLFWCSITLRYKCTCH